MKPGDRLAKMLRDEADRIEKLGYGRYSIPHELRSQASAVASAQSELGYSKELRRRRLTV